MEEKKTKEVKLEIQLDDDTAQGTYSNLTVVNHNESEFVVDFIFVQPQAAKAKVCSRVILSPQSAKRLVSVLQESVGRFEESAGKIKQMKQPIDVPSGQHH